MPAKLLSRPLPVLPAIAKQRGLYGVVTLSATVDKQGAVSNVKVVRGYPALGAAARDAVLKSRYQPATLDGQPIESSIQIEVSFERK
jgi:protein TonB